MRIILNRLKECVPFNRTVARSGLIVVAQAMCVAVGLWLHHCYVDASSDWTAKENAYAELDEVATELLFELRDSDRPRDLAGPDGALAAIMPSFADDFHQRRIHVAAADSNWRVSPLVEESDPGQTDADVAESENGKSSPDKSANELAALQWRPAVADVAGARMFQRGILVEGESVHPAVAWSLGRGKGHGLVYRRAEDIIPDAFTIRSALPFAGLIAFVWVAGVQSVIVYLALSKLDSDSKQREEQSESMALRQAEELVRTQDAIIFGLAKLAESRDTDTGQHLERISLYSTRLAEAMRKRPKFREQVSPSFVRLIGISSALHDIGKVGVADSILKKPGRLDDDERRHMQQHARIGGDCLRQIEKRLGASNFLEMAREIGLCHHERWDGQGYPNGLKAERIPLAARIVSICDVYDALSNRRCYKEPYSHLKCVQLIAEGAGTQFDPDVTDVFLEIESEFRLIALQYREPDAPPAVADQPVKAAAAEKAKALPLCPTPDAGSAESGEPAAAQPAAASV